MKSRNPIVCVVCFHTIPAAGPLLEQIEALEDHLAAEHGVDL